MRIKTQIKHLETYGFKEQKKVMWRIWIKSHELKGTPICVSENDLKTIKNERELLLVLDNLNR